MDDNETAALCREVSAFIIEGQWPHFGRWPHAHIFRYVAWHILRGQCFCVRNESGRLDSVGFAWPESCEALRSRARAGLPMFSWTELPQSGDCLYIAQICARQSTCGMLWKMVFDKWPHILRVFACRHRPGHRREPGKIIELHLNSIERFLKQEVACA